MSGLQSLPPVGLIVIVSIVALFVLAVLLLFYVSARYKHLSSMVTGNLDKDTATGILNLLMRINSESGTAIIMVTHNREICRKWPERIFEIKEETCTEITTGPEIRQEKEEEKSDEAE